MGRKKPFDTFCVASILVQAMCSAVLAEETFKQSGPVHFKNFTGDIYHASYPPIEIEFPVEFGGTPTVTIDYPKHGRLKAGWHWAKTWAANVKNTGFDAMTDYTLGNELVATWTAVGPKLYLGTVTPSYLVLTIIYAPPGTAGGHSTSLVNYQSGSTTGTTTSASKTFKSDSSVSYDVSSTMFGNGAGDSTSFDVSHSATYADSVDIKKTVTSIISQNGPSKDGIDHDSDEIWLLLKPSVIVSVSTAITKWKMSNSGGIIQYLHVGWLNGHQTMPPGVLSALQDAGVTSADYPVILARDPLAGDEGAITSPRFVPLNTTFPYEPPYASTDTVPVVSYNISDNQISTKTTTIEDSYTVKSTSTQSAGFNSYFSMKVQNNDSWGWTNKSVDTKAKGLTQTAQVSIGGPAYGYCGPTTVRVYLDALYNTFAFSLVGSKPQSPTCAGGASP